MSVALARDERATTPAAEPAAPERAPRDRPKDDAASAAVRGLFGRDSAYLVLWAAQLGAAALFTPIATRLLGPSRFGLVASLIAVMQVLVAVAGFGLQSAVQRRYARSGERDARRLITLAIAASALVFLIAQATGPRWAAALGLGQYPAAVRFAVTWASLTAISNAALGLLRSRDQLGPFATVEPLTVGRGRGPEPATARGSAPIRVGIPTRPTDRSGVRGGGRRRPHPPAAARAAPFTDGH